MIATNLKENGEWIRRYVLDHPDATVHDLARHAHNSHRAMPVHMIADIRRQVLESITRGGQKPAPAQVTPRGPSFNPPKLVVPPPAPPAPGKGPKEVNWMTPQAQDPGEQRKRRDFVDQYALEHPTATTLEIRKAAAAKFGIAVSTHYVRDAISLVRGVAGIGSNRAEAAAAKRTFALELLGQSPRPDYDDVIEKMRAKFGSGISRADISTLVSKLSATQPKPALALPASKAAAAPAPPVPATPAPTDVDATVLAAAKGLKSAMQAARLRKVVITIEDNAGQFAVAYETEVHVQNKKGTVIL